MMSAPLQSSAEKEGCVNVSIYHGNNEVDACGNSNIGGWGNTEPTAVLDNSENNPCHNNASVQRSVAPTKSSLAELLYTPL